MFTTYSLLLFSHLLLFVYWLGADIGVFYGIRYVLKPELSLETRRTVMAVVHWIDALPRICLVLMMPVGLTLASTTGLLNLPDGLTTAFLVAAWVVGLAWLVIVLRIYKGARGWIARVDWVVRIAVMLGFLVAGIASLAGIGPAVEGANWLAVKMMLFAGAIGCGIGLRILAKPFVAAYSRIMERGSTPDVEAALSRAMRQSKQVVLLLWLLVAAAAYIGVAKGF